VTVALRQRAPEPPRNGRFIVHSFAGRRPSTSRSEVR
jgi:hypothetical protein